MHGIKSQPIIQAMSTGILFSCEHASNQVPKKYLRLFSKRKNMLNTHQGWDIGAYLCYQALCKAIPNQHLHAKWSRLFIELNRSLHHPRLFSDATKILTSEEKKYIIEKYYVPYYKKIMHLIEKIYKTHDQVMHLSIHSFTPKLNNIERTADVGILYDPKRKQERSFAYLIKKQLKSIDPEMIIRMNYPYLGTSDGLTTQLRKKYQKKLYQGIELEINQKFFLGQHNNHKIIDKIVCALSEAVQIMNTNCSIYQG